MANEYKRDFNKKNTGIIIQKYNMVHSGVSKAFYAHFNGLGDGYFLNKGLKNYEVKEYEF